MTIRQRAFPTFNFSNKSTYDWEKTMDPKTLQRHKWLTKIWTELYFQNQEDEFIRKLSTEDMMNTRWFEKYGIKEPQI